MPVKIGIKINFGDGIKREYTLSDELSKKVADGEIVIFETQHPNHGERMVVRTQERGQ